MALEPEELFGDAVAQTGNLRAYPREDGIAVAQLETLGAVASIAHLTPLHNNGDGTWGVWSDNGGSADDTLEGFLWAPDEAVVGSDSGEIHIQVFKQGTIDARDIPLPAGETQGTLDALLQGQTLRTLGIIVKGIDSVS